MTFDDKIPTLSVSHLAKQGLAGQSFNYRELVLERA